MYEGLPGSISENEHSILKVKIEDTTCEQAYGSQEQSSRTQELCRLQFRQFCYQQAPGPREALAQLRELCRQWLRPEMHSKEQILELLVLEQFLAVLPGELQAWVQMYPLQSGEEAVRVLENLAAGRGDTGQQASFYIQEQDMHLVVTDYQGASLESHSLQLLPRVTTLPSEPPQLPQEVSGECHRMSVKTEEEPAQASALVEWPRLSLAPRNLCGNSAQETATGLMKQNTCEEIGPGVKTSEVPSRN